MVGGRTALVCCIHQMNPVNCRSGYATHDDSIVNIVVYDYYYYYYIYEVWG